MNTTEKELIVSDMLKEVGVDPSLKGYRYLLDAILIAFEGPKKLHAITKDLYPTIAERNETKASRVERCIRHSIEKCFNETDPDMRAKYLGNCTSLHSGKVTNSTFIALMVEALNTKIKGGAQNDSEA